jgi:arylsulfatase A-like enzyme
VTAPLWTRGIIQHEMVFEGLLIGAVFGLVETSLAFGTGRLPRDLWPLFFYPGVLLGLAVGLLLEVVRHLSASRLPTGRQARTFLVVAPIFLLALRGGGHGSRSLAILGWAGAGLLAGVAVWAVGLKSRVSCRRIVTIAALTQLLAASGLALRWGGLGSLARQGTTPLLTAVGVGLAGLLLSGSLAPPSSSRLRGRRLAGVLAMAGVLNLAAFATSRLCGSAPPSFPPLQSDEGGDTRRNLVLIVLDTVRRDHLSLYGYTRRTSPHLDRFAQRALTCTDVHATSSYTLASHASLFTGKLPGEHEARQVPWDVEVRSDTAPRDYPLARREETLAEVLRSRGYLTMAAVANVVYLRPWTGLDQGFQYYDCRPGPEYGYAPLILPFSVRFLPDLYNDIELRELRSARDITREAVRLIRRAGDEHPFFLFVNYMDAHWPYRSPRRVRRRFVSEAWAPWSRVASWETPDDHAREQEPGQRDAVVGHYDAAIAFIDEQLEELFEVLDGTALRKKTIVVVTSDHGESLGEHGLVMHDNSLYEEETRIPLVIGSPDQSRRLTVDVSLDLTDVHELILRALDGRPLEVPPRRGPVVRAQMWARARSVGPPYQQASYLEGWKLISGDMPRELYDLSTDPAETQNRLRDTHLPLPARELLDARRERPADPEVSGVVLSREDRARLRVLGYAP